MRNYLQPKKKQVRKVHPKELKSCKRCFVHLTYGRYCYECDKLLNWTKKQSDNSLISKYTQNPMYK